MPTIIPSTEKATDMQTNWQTSLNFTFNYDGFKDDQAAGESFATSYGVTEYTWNDAVEAGIVTGSIADATQDQCITVLHDMFWNKVNGDGLPSGCDVVVYNNGMVCGAEHAAKLAQRVVGVAEDGAIGPITLLAIKGFGVQQFIDAMTAADEKYFAALAKAPLYLIGWDRREEACKVLAYQLAGIAAQ
jgi:lysozyme family protein